MRADPSESSSPETTSQILVRARAGDPEALERLFIRHAAPLRLWTRGRLPRWARDLADTDDLVQETLLRTFTHLDGFEPRSAGALQAYLRQAIVNRIRDELRRQRRRPARLELDDRQPAHDVSPLEQAIGRDNVRRYERALARLEPAQREAIIARVELGCSYGELAQALGKPTADAARKHVQRALVKLAEEMAREPDSAGR